MLREPYEETYLYVSFETIVADSMLECVSVVELCEIMFTEGLIELFICVIDDHIACKMTTMPTNGKTLNSAKRRAYNVSQI